MCAAALAAALAVAAAVAVGAAEAVAVPSMGDSISEGTVVEWRKGRGKNDR